jgi:hypothetical protein
MARFHSSAEGGPNPFPQIPCLCVVECCSAVQFCGMIFIHFGRRWAGGGPGSAGVGTPARADLPSIRRQPGASLSSRVVRLPQMGCGQGAAQDCEPPHIAAAKNVRAPVSPSSMRCRGEANARRDDGNGRRGRDWPDLVGRCDVQVGPGGRFGNEVGWDVAAW